MPDVEAVAAPSAAEVNPSEPIELPRSNTPEYAEWRKTGTIPAKSSEAKIVDPPATDTPKEETAVEPDPAAGKQQESRRKPDAEARILQLTAEKRKLEKDLEEARKPKEAKADPPPARQPDANVKPKIDDKNPDGTLKWKDYEEYGEAVAEWKVNDILAKREVQQAQAKQKESFDKNVAEARTRYEDFDSKAMPVVQALFSQGTPQVVLDALNDSPVIHDLLYAIGGDDATKADFLKTAKESPSKAMRLIVLMEQPIMAELSKSSTTERNGKGQFVKPEIETPAKRGPESAPNPPLEIGNRGGIPKESDAAETGDFAAFRRQRNAEDLRRQKGA